MDTELAKILIIFVVILSLYINGSIISYLYNLQDINCECALTSERNYIMFYTLYSIILTFIFITITLFNPSMLVGSDMYTMSVVNRLLSFINVIVTIYYLNKIRNCACSESPNKRLMFYIAAGAIFVYIFNIIFGSTY
jgi:hypothetical protein